MSGRKAVIDKRMEIRNKVYVFVSGKCQPWTNVIGENNLLETLYQYALQRKYSEANNGISETVQGNQHNNKQEEISVTYIRIIAKKRINHWSMMMVNGVKKFLLGKFNI